MRQILKIPITNALTGSIYTGLISIGDNIKLNVILDTGSSTLAVDGRAFDPTQQPSAKTTRIAQEISYGANSWVGAVIETAVALPPSVILENAKVAVTYHESPKIFGNAQGIWGLAYKALNRAFLMPANAWDNKYGPDQIKIGRPIRMDTFFCQLNRAGIVANEFAFYTKRSLVRAAAGASDRTTDPMNQGILVIGGGKEATELYEGTFTSLAVLDDTCFDFCLLSVQVGERPPIQVWSPSTRYTSNSVLDSGAELLIMNQALYDRMLLDFHAINAAFAPALATPASVGFDQSKINLQNWPNIQFTFFGADSQPATLTISPCNYWQFDAGEQGKAVATVRGDGGRMGGRSVLGLPLFNEYYTVFEPTRNHGRGVVSFAKRTSDLR
jgi:hypothetical protein